MNLSRLSSRAALLLALALAATACGLRATQDMPATTERGAQTYTGVLPCADCPGIDQVLTLFPDGSYRLRLTYRERRSVFHELGRWSLGADGARLHLSRVSGARDYEVLPRGLRLLDQDGHAIESPFNYVLSLQGEPDLIAEPMPLRGMFRLDGPTASLLECQSGETFTVKIDESNAFLALHRRYRTAASLGDPVLVRISGRFEGRGSTAQAIRVEQFDGVEPDKSCP